MSHEMVQAQRQLDDAKRFLQTGHMEEAMDACRNLLAQHGDYVGALRLLSGLYLTGKKYDLALPCLVRLSMLCPDDPATLVLLAEAYLELQGDQMALVTLQQALTMELDDANAAHAHLLLGRIHEQNSDYIQGAEHFGKSAQLASGPGQATFLMGGCYAEAGDHDKARAAFQKALKADLAPLNKAQIYYSLSRHPKAATAKKLLSAIEALNKSSNEIEQGPQALIFNSTLEFSRASVLESMGKHGEAWQCLEAANASIHRTFKPSSLESREDDRRALRRAKYWDYAGPVELADYADVPISLLILGVTQSGKSTLESLLASVDGVKRGYENNVVETAVARISKLGGLMTLQHPGQLPEGLHAAFTRIYAEELSKRSEGARVFTNTHPGLIADFGRIAETLPNLRVIFIERDVDDTAFRMFCKLYPPETNPHAYDVAGIYEFIEGYGDLIDIWEGNVPGVSMRISYEEMVAEPKLTLEKVTDFCGIAGPKGAVPEIGDDRGCAKPYLAFLKEARG